jgi:Ca-activated chloride channel family protein
MKPRFFALFLTSALLVALALGFYRWSSVWAGETKHADQAEAQPQTKDSSKPAAQKPDSTAPPKKVEIALDKATTVALPPIAHDLKPEVFKTEDGKSGWVVRVPGGSSIPTPAFADGMIFVSGGYSSHEFYAFNADTGDLVWKMDTGDWGPTAGVVEAGYLAFNTVSTTLSVVDEKTGKLVWRKWLGDPLLSQPAISKGRLFMAYPAGQRGRNQQLSNVPAKQGEAPATARESHRLLAVDLKTGRDLWEQPIPGEVISAPVVSGDTVYFTCFDGTSFALNAADGKVLWKKKESATSAPVIAGGQVMITRREQVTAANYEGLERLDAKAGESKDKVLLAREKADYLGAGTSGGIAPGTRSQLSVYSIRASTAPPAANVQSVTEAVNVSAANYIATDSTMMSSDAGGWAYQGSRAAYSQGQMLNAQGRNLNSINAENGRTNWQAEVRGSGVSNAMQVFSPPALGRDYMYLSSARGHLVSVRQKDGSVGFNYFFKQPMVFQPALAHGNVYAGTSQGLVICLKTGNADADGWYEWGGNAQHNKSQ